MTQRPPQVQQLRQGLRCVLANNPSPMTHWGTNTFILGAHEVAVIDPGPDDADHLQAILAALDAQETISHIFVTHSHIDHSPLAVPLSRATGAPVYGFGGPTAGRSAIMQRLAATGLAGGGEGVDPDFCPDITLQDGQTIVANTWELTARWTPGHMGNHLCFAWRDAVICGDLIMAWASSLVSPPDGDLTDFMASLHRLEALNAEVLYPAHGPQINDPAARIAWLLEHRQCRSDEILHRLASAPADAAALTQRIYSDTPKSLLPAAQRNVFAHLIDLARSGQVGPVGQLAESAVFKLI